MCQNKKNLIFILILLILLICFINTSFASTNLNELIVNVCGFNSDTEGDCTIITYKDVQILVDSAQSNDTFEEIKIKMNNIMENDNNKVWDYVIMTHGDSDHLGNATNIFNYLENEGWTIGNIIDFDFKDATTDFLLKFQKTNVLDDYRNKRNEIINKEGSNTQYFTAAELDSSNLYKEYTIDDNISLKILYNYFDNYEVMNKLFKTSYAPFFHNLISVCFLIEYNGNKILFTGDLEEVDSANKDGNNQYYSRVKESDLENFAQDMVNSDKFNYSVNENSIDKLIGGERLLLAFHRDLLTNITLFKAAHHGSRTSNSNYFLECIKPQYVAITKGPSSKSESKDYIGKFPALSCLNEFLKYTDYIYPTKVYVENSTENDDINRVQKLYGDLNFTFSYTNNKVNVIVDTEKNNNVSDNAKAPQIWDAKLCIKDGDVESEGSVSYFEQLRNIGMWTSTNIPVISSLNLQIIDFASDSNTYGNCTLLKIGHYDILIDCGSMNSNSLEFVKYVEKYCYDGILEYVFITTPIITCYSQMVGTYKKNKSNQNGIFDKFIILNLIDFNNSNTWNVSNANPSGLDLLYQNIRDKKIELKEINYITDVNNQINIIDDFLSFSVYKPTTISSESNYHNSISIVFKINILGSLDLSNYVNAIFCGSAQDFTNLKIENNNSVIYMRAPSCFGIVDNSNFIDQLSKIKPQNIVIGPSIGYFNTNSEMFGNLNYLETLLNKNIDIKNSYFTNIDCSNVYNGSILTNLSYNENSKEFECNVYNIDKKIDANDVKKYFDEIKKIPKKRR